MLRAKNGVSNRNLQGVFYSISPLHVQHSLLFSTGLIILNLKVVKVMYLSPSVQQTDGDETNPRFRWRLACANGAPGGKTFATLRFG
ncbi:hypothetical protein NQZ68_012554 [Dissostichus eleginoides]|nr:hypothetical protein NQZ68_012554 [Dissostichus eleginoides]